MSSNTPQTERPAPPRRGARALFRLTLALGLLGLHVSAAAQQPDPAQTPRVRPRTVAPKPPEAPAPTPEPQAAPQISEAVAEDEVVRVESNLVLIPASVVDTRGRAITDLRLEDFELKVDGEPKLIDDLSRAETPVNIALLFDNSKSLSAAREFEKQAALRFFRSVIRPIDRAAIYSFANTPRLEIPFTNNIAGLVRTIENFGAPEGATALYDTIAQAADYIGPLPGRKVIVLVSDGADTLSDVNFDEALKRTLRAEVQIYVVQTRQIEDPNLHDSFSEQMMQKLTEQTGGAVFVPQSIDDLDSAFTQISLDLSQQYVLSYNPQDERQDSYFRFVNVSVKTRPQLRVRARKGFYPPGVPPGTAPPAAAEDARPLNAKPNGKAAPNKTAAGASRNARGRAGTPSRAGQRASTNGRVGPSSPDEEERPRQPQPAAQEVEESHPTMRLTVAEAAPTATARHIPQPTPQPTPAYTAPPPSPSPSPAPSPAEAAVVTEKNEEAKRAVVSGGVLNGKALNLPRPNYPQVARTSGVTGTVIIEVTIDERGRVADVRVLSGHPLLQQAALNAARQAKFSPTVLSGEPVRVKGTINYTFSRP